MTEENGWVNIKADMPDYDLPVLWHLEDGQMVVEALDKDGNDWLFGSDDKEIEELFPIPKATHWRLLPPPPII